MYSLAVWRPEVRINISAGVSSGYKLESRCKPSCKGFRGESISCLFQLLYLWCIIPISVSFFLTASSSSLRCQTFFCFTVRDTCNWIQGLPGQSRMGLPRWLSGKESACQCRRHGFDPWSGKIPQALEQRSRAPQLPSLCSGALVTWSPRSATREASREKVTHCSQRKPAQQRRLSTDKNKQTHKMIF